MAVINSKNGKVRNNKVGGGWVFWECDKGSQQDYQRNCCNQEDETNVFKLGRGHEVARGEIVAEVEPRKYCQAEGSDSLARQSLLRLRIHEKQPV